MPDAGSIYYNSLTGFGNDIAGAMEKYHREHQAYDQQLGIADALSRIGVNEQGRIVPIVPDEKGKVDKSIQPVLDPKAVEMFRSGNRRDWARSAGALEALSRVGIQYLNRASEQNIEPKYPVQVGGTTYPLTAAQAATTGIRREENEAAALAAKPRERRAERGMELREKAAEREDVRLNMSAAAAQGAALEKRPEITFSRKYGLTPQALIGLQESDYVAKDPSGQPIGRTGPLPPGQTAQTFPSAPSWFKELVTLGLAKPDPTKPQSVQWEPQNPEGNLVFRESKFDYSPSAKTGTPKRERFLPDPEGQFMNVRGTRIPIGEVSAVQNAATAAKNDLVNTLASPRFQALTPEQQTAAVLKIKDRLSTLGYNPNDPFWGLPQQ